MPTCSLAANTMNTPAPRSAPGWSVVAALVLGSLASPFIVATSQASAQDAPAAVAAPQDSAPAAKPQIHEVIAASAADVQAFNEHLIILASPWMDGRLPGTKGMERAMDYMEAQFIKAGLEPSFQPSDGSARTYRQPFSLGGKRETVEETITLKCGGVESTLVAGTDFKLTSLGKNGSAEGTVAFVGYGVESGPDGYTSFTEGHSLEGKIALVLRFEPMKEDGTSRWTTGEGWSGQAGFQTKIAAVAKRKPAAILVVNTPGANDPRIDSLTAGGGRAMADVPVFMVSTAAAERLVASCEGARTLMDLRKLADEPKADAPHSFDLSKGGAAATIAVAGRTEERPVKAENIVATLPGRGALAQEYIVIGGHLDHLGMGDFGSREGPGKLHPGADDNASGAAGIILLGESLKAAYAALPAEQALRSVVFIGFSAEESGLIGSRHYVDHPIYPIKDTVLMMNFDMIGRVKDGRLAVTNTRGVKGFMEWAQPIYDKSPLTIVKSEGGGGGGSDHASFQAVGVPILFAICADFHADYHTSRDTFDLIDRETSVAAVHLWHDLALSMAAQEKRFEVETNNGPMRPAAMKVRAGLRTKTAESGTGLEIIDVTKDGSAEKAGIRKGDLLLKWNDIELTTREAFVDDLRSKEPGAKVQAVVRRDGKELTLTVELQGAKEAQ